MRWRISTWIPNFSAKEGSNFWAYIVEDDGTYQYDAVGNLVKEYDEGVLIRWTSIRQGEGSAYERR